MVGIVRVAPLVQGHVRFGAHSLSARESGELLQVRPKNDERWPSSKVVGTDEEASGGMRRLIGKTGRGNRMPHAASVLYTDVDAILAAARVHRPSKRARPKHARRQWPYDEEKRSSDGVHVAHRPRVLSFGDGAA